ncbi:MAG: hypothetical protein ABJB49_01420 [Nitrospirota bacterium]
MHPSDNEQRGKAGRKHQDAPPLATAHNPQFLADDLPDGFLCKVWLRDGLPRNGGTVHYFLWLKLLLLWCFLHQRGDLRQTRRGRLEVVLHGHRLDHHCSA